jgi:tetratricopeptide (TPR) repeat protein/transcriptional regulator with XRE-family HTH domain
MATGEPLIFGETLRRYRLAAGLTQEELAERAHLSARAISDLERGARRAPYRDTVRLLAEGLRLDAPERALLEAAARRGSEPVVPQARPNSPPLTTAPPVRPAGSAPPFVGRVRELDLLERHLAGEGPPLLLLAGEPGIGKSRLLAEAAQRALQRGWRVLEGGCQRRGGQEPYAPLVEALEGHVHRQSPTLLRQELRGCGWLVHLLPELAATLSDALPVGTLAPERERRLMFAAVARFLANVAGPAGTLLLLDDLQWANADAFDLLAALAYPLDEVPLRILGAYRNTEIGVHDPLSVWLADLAHGERVTHLTLPALAPEEASHLLDGMLADLDSAEAALRAQVIQRAGGVPFFLVSCARGLRADQPGAAGVGHVPWNLTQSIRQRVATLPALAQEVLGIAAVAGREVARGVLLRVSDQEEREVLSALQMVCRAQLLEELGDSAYRFAHDVVREVVEADLGAARRAWLHREIATALEGLPGAPPLEALAYHYARAAEPARAGHWLEQAGDQAAAGFANATAREHYAAAREHLAAGGRDAPALSRLDEKVGDMQVLTGAYAQAQVNFARARTTAADTVRRAELRRKEGLAWHLGGDLDQALAAFAAALAESEAPSGEVGLPAGVRASIALSEGDVLWQWGHNEEVRAAAERALALLDAAPPGPDTDHAMARADHLLGRIAWTRGETARAEEYLRRCLAIYERQGDLPGCASAWYDLGWVAYQRGDLSRSEECCQRSLTIYERLGDQHGIGLMCSAISFDALHRGDFAQAEAYARRALALHAGAGLGGRNAGWTELAQLACERGDLAQAEEYLRRGLASLERSPHQGGMFGSAVPLNQLGTVAIHRGDLAAAEECFGRSLAIMERPDFTGFPEGPKSYAWHGLGEIARERGDLATAAGWYRRARHLARRWGAPDIEALAALGLVRARLAGLTDGAHRRRAQALLAQGCAMATRRGLSLPVVRAALLEAEVHLRWGALVEAPRKAEAALHLATTVGRKREEAEARRALAQCALVGGAPADAEEHVRAALSSQLEMSAALEAARTRVVLAQVLVARTAGGPTPDEARRLLAEAVAQFAASGAVLDLTRAEHVAATWSDQ